jgi:hypothetical protein
MSATKRKGRYSPPCLRTALLCSLVPKDQTDESVLGKIQPLVKEQQRLNMGTP